MTLQFHPAVQQDFTEALAYYEAQGGRHLAERFEAEFRINLAVLKTDPTRFPFYLGSRTFRRLRLKSFPYLIIYREMQGVIRVTLLKHEKRHPMFGSQRW